MIPILDSLAYRGAVHIPWRLARRMRARIGGPTTLAFGKLNANYDKFWMADSDACSSIDSHEGILFFESRGYEILQPVGRLGRILSRGEAISVRKPLH